MIYDFVVLPLRGLHLRTSPSIENTKNIVGSLKRGMHFYAIRVFKKDKNGLSWAMDKDGLYIVFANGHNLYVSRDGKPFFPIG